MSFFCIDDHYIGFEVYLGYSKPADNAAAQDTVAVDTVANTSTETLNYSGTTNRTQLLIGGAFKYRFYQSRYFSVSGDFLLTVTPGSSDTYEVGSQSTTTNTTTGNQAVQQTGLGTTTESTAAFFRTGPRASIDYHLPFLPNVMLGTTLGIFMSFGGTTTTTTTTTTQQYTVTGGTQSTPAPHQTSTSTTTQSPGRQSNTYALGGTGLNIGAGGLSPIAVVGTFRIRYAF